MGYNMVRSMTAFARTSFQIDSFSLIFEIKSVNGKYSDISVKLPRSYSLLEERIKTLICQKISRGKVDASLSITNNDSIDAEKSINSENLSNYLALAKYLSETYNLPNDVTVSSVMQNKDVFYKEQTSDFTDYFWNKLTPFIEKTIDEFDSMRLSEGDRLTNDLLIKKNVIINKVSEIEKISSADISNQFERFKKRLTDIIGLSGIQVDEQKILSESAAFADKIAIDEEIVRLRSHFLAFDNILKENNPVGRKLDFLIQEMNREINTIGSKCCNSDIAYIVVDIKCEIEKIREQVQNIE